ncbi:MAG: RsmE family RNA methyltransferase [Clostridium fessum]
MTCKRRSKRRPGTIWFFCHMSRPDGIRKTRELLASVKPGYGYRRFIGPEGGFEDEEVELARENGAEIVTLGKRILRTETAGYVCCRH